MFFVFKFLSLYSLVIIYAFRSGVGNLIALADRIPKLKKLGAGRIKVLRTIQFWSNFIDGFPKPDHVALLK